MSSWTEITQEIQTRAGHRCEYCKMHQALQGASFHIEHVLPSSRGGPTEVENLALACPSCNLHKADQTEAVDPVSGAAAPLFNPRRDSWSDHFRWENYRI
jgi:5-methylcytosine-specific restriction endonuclease McrA